MIDRLHVLTQDLESFSHEQQVELACKNGARWIQLRVKDKSYEEWREIAKNCVQICRKFSTQLIINDSVQIAIEVDADGVHLGKDDMPIHSARVLVGEQKIIGGTCNTIEDIRQAYDSGADYIGLGPYRFTHTKKNLSDILGIEGYREIIRNLKQNQISLPLIAIGGIQVEDVHSLLEIGVHGIAVSSAIFSSQSPEIALRKFIESIQKNTEKSDYAFGYSG